MPSCPFSFSLSLSSKRGILKRKNDNKANILVCTIIPLEDDIVTSQTGMCLRGKHTVLQLRRESRGLPLLTLFLSLSLSLFLSLFLSLSRFLFLSFSLPPPLFLSLSAYFFLSPSVSLCFSFSPTFPLLPLCLSASLCLFLNTKYFYKLCCHLKCTQMTWRQLNCGIVQKLPGCQFKVR